MRSLSIACKIPHKIAEAVLDTMRVQQGPKEIWGCAPKGHGVHGEMRLLSAATNRVGHDLVPVRRCITCSRASRRRSRPSGTGVLEARARTAKLPATLMSSDVLVARQLHRPGSPPIELV